MYLGLYANNSRSAYAPVSQVFTPLTTAWYEPGSAISTPWYQDSAGTTPITAVEQSIGYATDKSGSANNAIQATAGARPLLKVSGNAYSSLFDGSNDNLTSATGGGGSSGFSLITAINPTGGAGTSRTIFSDSGYRVRLNLSNQLEFSAAKAPTYGADTIINGDFAVDANWTKGSGWVIAAGLATAAAPTSTTLSQAQTLTAGVAYELTYTITGYVSGAIRPRFTGGTTSAGTQRFADGTYTEIIEASTGNTTLTFSTATFQGSLDNVILREVDAFTTVATAETASIGTTYLVSAWDDGVNLNAQLDSGVVATVPRSAMIAGTAEFRIGSATGTSGSTAFQYYTGNIYAMIYVKDSALTASQRAGQQSYVRVQAGV